VDTTKVKTGLFIFKKETSMVKLGDWVQRTREPLPGFPAFD